MSGDMCTSLGNGFTNLMSMYYLSYLKSGKLPQGVVEGDDGLFEFESESMIPTSEEFARLGFTIKMEKFENIGDAGFCGNIFDESCLSNVSDPRELLCKFGWSSSRIACGSGKKRLELLKAKALSLLFELPSCPIVKSLARWALRNTKKLRYRFENGKDWWEQQVWNGIVSGDVERLLELPIPYANRLLVDRKFGISPARQLELEAWFDAQDTLHPIPLHVVWDLMDPVWVDHFKFVEKSNRALSL